MKGGGTKELGPESAAGSSVSVFRILSRDYYTIRTVSHGF